MIYDDIFEIYEVNDDEATFGAKNENEIGFKYSNFFLFLSAMIFKENGS